MTTDVGKTGVDDYLAQGHTLDDLKALEVDESADSFGSGPTLRSRSADLYCVENGRLCWVKQSNEGETVMPLCNFNAWVAEEITRDNGLEQSGAFLVAGKNGSGPPLPTVEVSLSQFDNMNWVTREWGLRGIVSATQTAKGKLCEAIKLQSADAKKRTIYAHTGWREIDGQPVFLSAAGALGRPDVDVELEDVLKLYHIPDPVDDPREALGASLDFLNMGKADVIFPIFATMYLAPLADILEPAFSIFFVGHSGSFKSTVQGLALCHFGQQFDEFHLPAAWRDTQNKLEKLLFLLKDMPLVIDDWAPGSDSSKARELEAKAEHIIRAQGNRQGRGRLKSDTSSRPSYIPRGLMLTSGEHLPSGHSHTARIFSVDITAGDIPLDELSAAQEKKHLYVFAMAHYLTYLKGRWPELKTFLPQQFKLWRQKARAEAQHPRLPGVVAWLYAGLSAALEMMVDAGVLDQGRGKELAAQGWEIFIRLSSEQSRRVEDQRPAKRFINALRSLMDAGRVSFGNRDDTEPKQPVAGQEPIGWEDKEFLYLNPDVAYKVVKGFCEHTDGAFTIKSSAVWRDLMEQGKSKPSASQEPRRTLRVHGEPTSVVQLYRSALAPDVEEEESDD